MTHAEAIDKVCRFFRTAQWACFPEVSLNLYDPQKWVCIGQLPIPDVIAIKRNFKRKSIAIFEVKVSRADFLQEVRKKEFLKSVPFADKFYYACPDGLIKPEEVPQGCGLYYIMDGYCVCVKCARAQKVELTVDTLWSIILSYETKYITKKLKEALDNE